MYKISISQIEYMVEDGLPVIHIFGRDVNGALHEIKVRGFEPYFYVPNVPHNTTINTESIIRTEINKYKDIGGNSLLKVITKLPRDVGAIRGMFTKHYEADILFPNRFMIDLDVRGGGIESPSKDVHYTELKPCNVPTTLRTCIIDIECDDHLGFPSPEKSPILCITVWDSVTRETLSFIWPVGSKLENTIQYNTEEEMLRGFIDYILITDPDVLTGWNFNFFDAPYLLARMKTLVIPRMNDLSRIGVVREPLYKMTAPVIRGRIVFDMLPAFKKMSMSEKESYRLDAIGVSELKMGKIKHDTTVYEMWKNSPEKLIKYNQRDVEICVKLNDKLDIIGFFKEIANYVGCSMEDTIHSSKVVDMFILHMAHGKFVMPSKHKTSKKEFAGAVVLDPQTGVFDNIIVLDLKSLYPMCMMTLNASPETKFENGKHIASNGARFVAKPDGITRQIVTELLRARTEKKKLMNKYEYDSPEYKKYNLQQAAIKVIMNAYYGVSGYNQFRLYDSDVAGAVTATGRDIITFTKGIIRSKGYNVIYGDTDSCMVALGSMSHDNVLKIGFELEKHLNSKYDDFAIQLGVKKHYFEIKFEKVYERFFQAGKKKRYAGRLIWKEGKTCDKIDVTGFEFKRSDVAKVTKDVQIKVIGMILGGQTFADVSKYIRSILSGFNTYDIDYIGVPGGISKDLKRYDKPDSHIRGAKYANQNFGTNFGAGSKPKHVYVKRVPEGYPHTDVICFEYSEQVPDGFKVDYDTMIDKTIKSPIKTIVESVGWSWSEITTNQVQKTLF